MKFYCGSDFSTTVRASHSSLSALCVCVCVCVQMMSAVDGQILGGSCDLCLLFYCIESGMGKKRIGLFFLGNIFRFNNISISFLTTSEVYSFGAKVLFL